MASPPNDLLFIPRSNKQWIPLMFPMLICGMSWIMGGVPFVTDMGFSILTGLCLFYVVCELYRFPYRFGIGGLLLYGGVLIWFCHDYFTHWFGVDFNSPDVPANAVTIARVAFFHCLFILMMVFGLGIQSGQWLRRVILSIPEPENETFYFILMILLNLCGLSAYLFSGENFFQALYAAAFGTWTGDSINWMVGRSGNLNYSWGAYVAQIISVGQVGGVFASLFAIMISTKIWSKILCWALWLFWALGNFSGGRRGDMAFSMIPAIGFFFIKYQSQAAMKMFGRGVWSYVVAGVLSFFLLVIVQVEGVYRDVGLAKADLSQTTLTANRGNAMFSEGLYGWVLIPDQKGFFSNSFIGEGFIRPIPEQVYKFFLGLIPRALWHDKPVDGLWEWYNKLVTGDKDGTVGTTVAHGLVGSWYFNYGLGGVLEGGLFVGWLMGICERSLQESNGKPLGMLMSLGMAVWLFRIYRDFLYNELYTLLMGVIVLNVLVRLCRPFFSRGATSYIQQVPHEPAYGASYGV